MMKTLPRLRGNEQGIAMAITLMIVLAVGALATGAALVGTNHSLINRFYDRHSTLEAAADAGLEQARALINANKAYYPSVGYTALETNAPVSDAVNGTIPGVTRTTWVGPSGVTSGQYGVFGTIISMVQDAGGGKVIRRAEVTQESFAKFAYFTDVEPSNISFGGGDAIFGPVHTNDYLKIYSSGASFYSHARTAKTVQGAQYGNFYQGYTEWSPAIPMPTTADLALLRNQAIAGNTRIVGNSNGFTGTATTRLEFLAIDINGDGDVTDSNEGFMRVYQAGNADYVSGWVANRQLHNSETCGMYAGGFANPFRSGLWLQANVPFSVVDDSLETSRRRCYLGGDPALNGGTFSPTIGAVPHGGAWQPWPGSIDPAVSAARPQDAAYLWPLSRQLNPNFKGVIFVDGKVGISGVVRGRITIAATDDINIVDDLTYATDPGLGTCNDIVGIFSGDDIRVSDNAINQPLEPVQSSDPHLTYDDTKDEFIHGVVLALDIFTVEDYASGSGSAEPCEATSWGRGCLYLTGGIIQNTRGAVGTSAGTGYLKRYSYDPCAASEPPPYFPTTGHFVRSQYYEIDPATFNVGSYYSMITPP
ncbi:MAG: hypothetical protein R3E98_05260 [Gemmatimonadota bacterium]|nr:hypothetical protein [Gemmatimonadota bacterium]